MRVRSLGTRRSPRLRRALALGMYFGLLGLLSGFVVARRVSAHLSEQSTALGRKLDDFRELSGRVTRLAWNGQALSVSTLVVAQPVEQAIARFVALCDDGSAELVHELARARGNLGITSLLQRALTLRDLHSDGTGSAVCLAGLGEGGLRALVARAQRFQTSSDLSELGRLRFAFFRKIDAARTHVLLVRAEGALRLDQVLPPAGRDAVGDEAVPHARPPAAQRLVVARAVGTPHAVTVYRSERAADVVLVDYTRQLRGRGYARIPLPPPLSEQSRAQGPDAILTEAYRGGDQTFVITSRPDGAGSVLSVVRIGAQAIPHPASPSASARRTMAGRSGPGAARDPAFE